MKFKRKSSAENIEERHTFVSKRLIIQNRYLISTLRKLITKVDKHKIF